MGIFVVQKINCFKVVYRHWFAGNIKITNTKANTFLLLIYLFERSKINKLTRNITTVRYPC